MSPIALGTKHQDLLKAYLEVSKSEKPDWASIALKADFATAKYARDQFTLVKKKVLATPNGEPINLSDNHLALLHTVVGVLKADADWEKVAGLAKFKTAKYARDQWTMVKNKLGGGSTTTSTTAAATPTSKKGTPSRKRKKLGDDGGGEEECTPTSNNETPSKKLKTPKGKKDKLFKIKVKVEEADAEAERNINDGQKEDQGREISIVQAQVDEQIEAEMQEYVDDQSFDENMFRMY